MSVRKVNGNYNIIAKNLRKIRKEKNFSQEDLLRELSLLGITMYKNDIWRIETNQRFVKDFEIWGFVKVLGIKYEELFENSEDIIAN